MSLKRCYKFIFSTFVAAFIFCCFSGSAFALFDPVSAAMAGSAAASGFPVTGFTGLTPDAASTILNPGVTDPYDWGDLDKYGVVHQRDADTVEITLSPDIATAGERRLEAVNQAFGLSPGTLHLIGNYPAIGSYVFYTKLASGSYAGGSVGDIDRSAATQSFMVGNWASLDMIRNTATNFKTQAHVGQNSSNQTNYTIAQGSADTVHMRITNYSISPPTNWYFNFITYSSSGAILAISNNVTVSSQDISFTNYPCSIGRTNDSTIVDPLGRENKVTIPKSYVDNISYTPDTTITDTSIIEALLAAILEAYTEDDVEESIYIDPGPTPPGPTPVPGETIGETSWTTLEEYLDSWTESFGDWTETFDSWTESFGDWTEDVFSGWTEIFGDIYDAIVDGIGDIVGVLEDILTAVLDIAEAIIEGDTDLISGFLSPFFNSFKSWFDTIKQHISIWHYVVEWLSNIGTTFSFFFGVMSGTSYYFVLPIYAAFAGTVVIAIYRKFGR